MFVLVRKLSYRMLMVLLALQLTQACTGRAWYEGFKSSAQQKCQQLSSPEYEDCMQQSDMDYEAYKTEREGMQTSD